MVSDNGSPFQSAEYGEFLKQNGVQRVLVSPYHPDSDGLTERFVQTFKQAMESSVSDPERSLQQRLQNFLLTYRSTPRATTGSSPCKLFLNREVRTRLTLIKPDLARRVLNQQGKMKQHHDMHAKSREMEICANVLARNHLTSQKWQPGVVLECTA